MARTRLCHSSAVGITLGVVHPSQRIHHVLPIVRLQYAQAAAPAFCSLRTPMPVGGALPSQFGCHSRDRARMHNVAQAKLSLHFAHRSWLARAMCMPDKAHHISKKYVNLAWLVEGGPCRQLCSVLFCAQAIFLRHGECQEAH